MEYHNLDFWSEANVGFIALDRPGRRNALSFDLLNELLALTQELAGSDLRTVVLTGNGPDFCAGFDLSAFDVELLQRADPVKRYEAAQLGGTMIEAFESLPQITIAALHGNVVGGAVTLVASCDLRVADADTVFSIPEADLGMPMAWGGIERLVREFGPAITKELVLTCRPFTAQEGKAAGFLNAVTPPGRAMEIAKELAVHIAERPRLPIVTTKRHVAEVIRGDYSRDDAMGLITALDDEESTAIRTAYLSRFRTAE